MTDFNYEPVARAIKQKIEMLESDTLLDEDCLNAAKAATRAVIKELIGMDWPIKNIKLSGLLLEEEFLKAYNYGATAKTMLQSLLEQMGGSDG